MSTVLVSTLGKAGLGFAKEKLKKIYEGTSLGNAIRFTSLEYFNQGVEVGPALDRWTKSAEFQDISDRMARHDDSVTDDAVVASFIRVGELYLGPDYPTPINEFARSVLSRFAEQYRKFELGGPSASSHLSNQIADTKQELLASISERALVADENRANAIAAETLIEKRIEESTRLVKERQFLFGKEFGIGLLADIPVENKKALSKVENNIGACDLQLGYLPSAHEHFDKALELDPGNIKYIANSAMASLASGEYLDAERKARAVLVIESRHAQAALILIQALASQGHLDDVQEFVDGNGWVNDDAACQLALGAVNYNLSKYSQAEANLKKSIEIDDSEPQAHKLLSMVLFHPLVKAVQNDPPLFWRRILPQAEELPRAEHHATIAVELLTKASSPGQLQAALVIRAQIFAASGQLDLGLADCDRVLGNDPTDDYALNAKGMILFQQGEARMAVKFLEKVRSEGVQREQIVALASAYLQLDQKEDAIRILNQAWDSEVLDSLNLGIADALYHSYAKDLDKHVIEIGQLEDFARKFGSNVEAIILRAHILYGQRAFGDAEKLLDEAVLLATENQVDRIHLLRAQQAFFRSEWDRAAGFYALIIDEDAPLALKNQYAISLYNSGQLDQVLEFTSKTRNGGEPLPVLTEIEAEVLERVDVSAALELHLSLRRSGLDKLEMHLLRAVFLAIRTGDQNRAAELVEQIDESQLTEAHALSNAARARAITGKPGAIELAFKARKLGFDNPEYHSDYIAAFLMRDDVDRHLLDREEVEDETYVKLRFSTGEERSVTVSSIEGPDRARDIVSPSEPLGIRLLGKREGDVVTIQEGGFTPITAEILEIKSKYVAAFQDSMTEFARRFPENLDLQALSVKDNDFSAFFAQLDRRYAHVRYVMELHASNRLPLSVISALTSNSRIVAWNSLMVLDDGNVFASPGNFTDVEGSIPQSRLVLDLTAILTAKHLGVLDTLSEKFDLMIAQATLDEVNNELIQARLDSSKKKASIARTADGYVSHEFSENDRQAKLNYLEELVSFINEKTQVASPALALSMPAERQSELVRVLGTGPLHSIMLAQEHGSLLYADDLALAHFAASEFGVETLWTQRVIANFLSSGKISEVDYRRHLYNLIISNYRFPSFSIEEVIWMVEDRNWMTSPDLQRLLRTVFSVPDERWAVEAAAEIIKAASLALSQRETRFMFVDFVVAQLLEKKSNKRRLVDMLLQRVVAKFYLLPLNLEEVQRSLVYWRDRF